MNAVQSNPNTAAARMRRHRKRRRDGLRCLIVELRETKIEALMYKGLLKAETRHSKNAIKSRLRECLPSDRSLELAALFCHINPFIKKWHLILIIKFT